MQSSVNEVYKFISRHKDFRLSLGVVTSNKLGKSKVTLGAVNKITKERWVPDLEKAKNEWPDAQWTPITEQQAALFDAAYENEFNSGNSFSLSN
jgi:hypothetical protein